MQRRLMLDIETLGIAPGCIILSIGAVEFNRDGILKEFHVKIDPIDAERCGLIAQASTVMWWLTQPKEAQDALSQGDIRSLQGALIEFIGAFDWQGLQVWCNGASFDYPILQAAFKAVQLKAPWAYYNEMDHRTMKNLLGKAEMKKLTAKATLKHDALDDARTQALTLNNVFNKLGI